MAFAGDVMNESVMMVSRSYSALGCISVDTSSQLQKVSIIQNHNSDLIKKKKQIPDVNDGFRQTRSSRGPNIKIHIRMVLCRECPDCVPFLTIFYFCFDVFV